MDSTNPTSTWCSKSTIFPRINDPVISFCFVDIIGSKIHCFEIAGFVVVQHCKLHIVMPNRRPFGIIGQAAELPVVLDPIESCTGIIDVVNDQDILGSTLILSKGIFRHPADAFAFKRIIRSQAHFQSVYGHSE
jgi:hypothetical protein